MRNNNEKIDRQIELLGKYYPIDREKKLVTVTLRYEKVTDLLSEEVGISTRPQLNPEVLEKINRIIPTIPIGYQIELEFDVKDYEGFEPHQIMETFNDALEMNHQKTKERELVLSHHSHCHRHSIPIVDGCCLRSRMVSRNKRGNFL